MLIAILVILAALLIVGGVLFNSLFGQITFTGSEPQSYVDSIVQDPLDPDFSGTVINDPASITDTAASVSDIAVQGNRKNITNILLIGVETGGYNNYIGRSDTMLILTINTYSKTLTLTSLMRDILVQIPGRDKNHDGVDDYDKLNASYAYGGYPLLAKTIEKNFRIKLDEYIAVNYAAYSKAVDAMGGIDVDLSAEEAKFCGVGSTAKSYHLNGAAALMYVRIRYIPETTGKLNDFGRNSRQRRVLTKLLDKAKTMNYASLYGVMKNTFGYMSTNMTKNEFTDYILHSPAYLKYTLKTYYLPNENQFQSSTVIISGSKSNVLILKDPKNTILALQHEIYG